MKTKTFSIAIAASAISSLVTNGAIVVSYADQTPAYTVSSTDLVNGLTPAFSQGDFALEPENFTGGITKINDGAFVGRSAPNLATVGQTGGGRTPGSTLVYNFASAVDVASMVLYFGWGDGGRDDVPVVNIYTKSSVYATDLGSYTLLASTVMRAPSAGGNFSQVTISDVNGAIASNVRSVYFQFGAAENGFVGLGEIDVVQAIPEPAATLLGGLGVLALLRRRRA